MKNGIDRDIAETMRDEMIMKDKILLRLNDHPQTIPEIAEGLGCSGNNVMYWVMTMWRYGYLEETGKPNGEGYYTYRPVNRGVL